MDIYRINNPDGKDLTYLKDDKTKRTRKDKEDLCIKEIEFKHTRDYFYTKEYGMQGNSFDHGSVRMIFNRTQLPTGP